MDFSNISVIIFLHVVETLKWKCVLSGWDEERKITCRYYHVKELYFEPFSERPDLTLLSCHPLTANL